MNRYLSLLLPIGTTLMAIAPIQASAQSTPLANDPTLVSGPAPYQDAIKRFLGKVPKIVGGKPAPADAYPWQVSLGVSWIANPGDAHFCGASILSETWILTAAHCIEGLQPKDLKVTAGTTTLDGISGQTRNVSRILWQRDNYNPSTFDNDIALLELWSPIELNNSAAKIPLATESEEPELFSEERKLTVSGWGTTSEGGETVETLRFVEVPFVALDDCNAPLSYDGQVTENMICAGNMAGGEDSCQGDSGGPLSGKTAEGVSTQAGIVSWGEGCARPRKVGVYSRVARYGDWVAVCMSDPLNCPK